MEALADLAPEDLVLEDLVLVDLVLAFPLAQVLPLALESILEHILAHIQALELVSLLVLPLVQAAAASQVQLLPF